jgi:ribosomal protein S18 acetylase RimI-like enzyme
MPSLSSIDHRIQVVAQQIHVVRMAAYKQEDELLGVTRFPPLERRVDDILSSSEEFIGAFEEGTLAGVLSVCHDEEGRGISISSLVVHPAYQQRGLGQALVRDATERYLASEFTVQTAAANVPALALYARFGFKEYRRWAFGSEPLELVKLSRSPAPGPSAA